MRFATLTTALGILLLGAITSAQSVAYDYDRTVNFHAYRTYAWTNGSELGDQLNHARVVRAIEAQMAARGFVPAAPGTRPDVFIAYHASFDRNLEINAYSSGWGGPYFGGLRSGTASTQQVLTGTLVVDMTDAASGRIVWRGTASADVDARAKPEKREQSINKAAEKMFKKYPTRL